MQNLWNDTESCPPNKLSILESPVRRLLVGNWSQGASSDSDVKYLNTFIIEILSTCLPFIGPFTSLLSIIHRSLEVIFPRNHGFVNTSVMRFDIRVSNVVPYSITSAGHGRSWSWFLGSQPTVDLVIKPVVAAIIVHQGLGYFSSQRDHPLGRYQIILLGDRGTQVWVACPRPLCNNVQPWIEPATCKLQAWGPTNSVTASRFDSSLYIVFKYTASIWIFKRYFLTSRAAVRLKILITINRAIKIFNRD